MLLSYEVAFDKGFQWVKGGKLPGLRGGSDTSGCEGGAEPNGTDCWSTRLMWRTAGEGEGMSPQSLAKLWRVVRIGAHHGIMLRFIILFSLLSAAQTLITILHF